MNSYYKRLSGIIMLILGSLFFISKNSIAQNELVHNSRALAVTTVASDLIQEVTVEPTIAIIKKIVVLDPGHGGRDTGIKTEGLLAEKEFTLKVALIAKENLMKYKRIQVYLTRTKDKQNSTLEKTLLTNRKKADVFVSIHVMGQQTKKTFDKSMVIYTNHFIRNSDLTGVVESNLNQGVRVMPWDLAQNSMLKKSRFLAVRIAKYWYQQEDEIKLLESPIALLSGIHAPAVLIEIDNNSPLAEQPEKDKELKLRGQQLAQGIIHYLF